MQRNDPALSGVAATDAARVALARPPAPTFRLEDCYGPVGDYVRLWAPHTEAAPVAIYACALAAVGALIGRGPTWHFGNADHHVRMYVLVIGASGRGRKGTAHNLGVGALLAIVDPDFARSTRILSGMSSAEGLIEQLRDATPDRTGPSGQPIAGDPGVADKRLIVLEGEIGGAFEAMGREGNRLSAITRDAWDAKSLRSLVKRDPQCATDPHLIIIGAITPSELRKLLGNASVLNGFANRFLPIWATRARLLPDDSAPDPSALADIGRSLAHRIDTARTIGYGRWTPLANARWREDYKRLAVIEDASESIRALLERGAPYVRRIAFLLALLDGSGEVGVPHLDAALALWRYVADSWRFIYADGTTRTPLADKLLAALAEAGAAGLTRTEIREDVVGSGDVAAATITAALGELAASGLAIRAEERTAGRNAERWRHARYVGTPLSEAKGENEAMPPLAPFPPFPEDGDGEALDDGYWQSLAMDAAT